jgi:microcystin-dependent protein|nr:MAG TPA: tailspike protein [Caudoviricetes sp.]
MTVQNTTVKDIYVGNGATTKFPITFQMTDHPEYIKVYITGDDNVAVETENFSVDLGAKTVTYPANGDPLPDGHKITIYRELPLYQLMNLVNQGPFFAENIELSFDDLTFMCQQLNEKLNRTLSTGVDVNNFNNTFPVKAGMSFRINDAGDGLVLTEDPARVLPLAKDVLEQTKQVKESAVNETTNIKNTAIEELTAIKDAAVNETTKIKDEAVAAKNTAVEAAATAAEDAAQKTVENITAEIDSKVAAAEDSRKAAAQSASSAADSMKAAQTSKEAAEASAKNASDSATTATRQADRAQDIADSLEGLAGVTGIATTDEAIAGVVDNKAMTPLKTKEAIEQGTNVFKALNTFRANIIVSNGTAAGSSGNINFGISPTNETVQARIGTDNLGGLFYHASTNQPHVFRVGTNNNVFVIRDDNTKVAFSSNNNFFATVTHDGVAKWLGNANTATKLETSRTINGVAFDGTKDIIVDSNPVGTIIAVAYTGVPEGYMHCNGAAVNRTTYVNLFNKIGTFYGAGDGSTTFNLPNTVARFLEGGIGAGTYYEAGLPNITGNISAFKSSISGAFVGSNNTNRYDGWNDNEDEYAVSTSFDASRSNSIYGASTTVQPPAMTVIYCIKY